MKYNTIQTFERSLSLHLATSTAQTYAKAIDFLLDDQYILDCKTLDIKKVMQKLNAMKYKSQYSKYKNAFLYFCEYLGIELGRNILDELENMITQKKKKYRRLKAVSLCDISNSIRVIRDKKLRLSYQTMLACGLRVSELSNIRKEDCSIAQERICFSITSKGQKMDVVAFERSDNKVLFEALCALIKGTPENSKVFYSANYLQSNVKKRGFQCHDLRRAYAKLKYKEYKDIVRVQKLMRHSSLRNTKIYLKSKVKI